MTTKVNGETVTKVGVLKGMDKKSSKKNVAASVLA